MIVASNPDLDAELGPLLPLGMVSVDEAQATHLAHISDAAIITLFLYDFILLLPTEINLVWCSSPWNKSTAAFLVQRYMPFLDTILVLVLVRLMPGHCVILHRFSAVCALFGICISEAVLGSRIRAMWNHDRRVRCILLACICLCWGTIFVLVGVFLKMLYGIQFQDTRSCFVFGPIPLFVAIWAVLSIVNLVMFVAVALLAYQMAGNKWWRTQLLNVLYGDGLIYYFLLFMLGITNVLVMAALLKLSIVSGVSLLLFMNYVERIIHSMITSRVVLHLRATLERELCSDFNEDTKNTRLEFAAERGISTETRTDTDTRTEMAMDPGRQSFSREGAQDPTDSPSSLKVEGCGTEWSELDASLYSSHEHRA